MLDEISTIQTVNVILPTRCGQKIRKRCIAKPTEHQAILLHKLGMHLPRSLEAIELYSTLTIQKRRARTVFAK